MKEMVHALGWNFADDEITVCNFVPAGIIDRNWSY